VLRIGAESEELAERRVIFVVRLERAAEVVEQLLGGRRPRRRLHGLAELLGLKLSLELSLALRLVEQLGLKLGLGELPHGSPFGTRLCAVALAQARPASCHPHRRASTCVCSQSRRPSGTSPAGARSSRRRQAAPLR
jgi:hypothetical protein